jgi:hypothetical protein
MPKYPKLMFPTNIPITYIQMHGNAWRNPNKFKQGDYQYTYAVMAPDESGEEIEHRLYATSSQHKQMVELGGGKGAVYTCCKKEEGGKKFFEIVLEQEPEEAGIAVMDGEAESPTELYRATADSPEPGKQKELPLDKPPQQQKKGNEKPAAAAPRPQVDLDTIVRTMGYCLSQARLLWEHESKGSEDNEDLQIRHTPAEIHATAACMFIQATKVGAYYRQSLSPGVEDARSFHRSLEALDTQCATMEDYLQAADKVAVATGYDEATKKSLVWHCIRQAVDVIIPGEKAESDTEAVREKASQYAEYLNDEQNIILAKLLKQRAEIPW